MEAGTIIKTVDIETRLGKFTVPLVTYAGEFYGKKNYFSHCYDSLARPRRGGCMFAEGSITAEKFGL